MEAAPPAAHRQEQQPAPIPLGIGKSLRLGPSPVVALLLAVLVGVLVFTLIWRVRKTFGMRE